MRKAKKIDFNNGIRIVMKRCYPTRRLDEKSEDLLDTILNHISSQLVDRFNAEYEASRHKEKKCHRFAQKAVAKTFTGKLKKQAITESARQLAMYDTGCLKHSSTNRAKKKQASVSKHKPSSTAEFQAWLPKLCPPGPSLDAEAEAFLSRHLLQFMAMVVASSHPEEVLQPHDLKNTLGNFLGPEVYKIACKEGVRALEIHVKELTNEVLLRCDLAAKGLKQLTLLVHLSTDLLVLPMLCVVQELLVP